MEFYQLEAFVMVAAHRSFSRAAEHLYLSQPTISAHVKSLETELATALFDRGKTGLSLTVPGETLYRYARDMLDMRAAALAELHGHHSVGEEKLQLAASSVPCQYLLPRAAARFEASHPTVSVSLRQENSRQVCEDIFRYHFPLGVVGEIYQLPHLVFTPIVRDELVAAIPRREEYNRLIAREDLSIEDLAGYKLLLREPGSGTRAIFEQELAKANYTLAQLNVCVFDNQETIKQAVRQGLGISVLSRLVVEEYEKFGILSVKRLPELSLSRSFYLVHHSKRVLSPAARALLEFLPTYFLQEDAE